MGALVALVAVGMIFSIPLVAIYTSYQLRMKKMELDGGVSGGLNELKRELGNLMNENEAQRERIKALEEIVAKVPSVSHDDKEKLRINIEQNEMSLDEIEKWKKIDNKNKLF